MKKGTLVFYNSKLYEIFEKRGPAAVIYDPDAETPETTMQTVAADNLAELKPGDKVNKTDSDGNQLYYYGLSCMKYRNAYMLRLGTINQNRRTAGNYARQSISA